MKCPICGASELIQDIRDVPYQYKGEARVILTVTGDYCPVCHEIVLDREHGDRFSDLVGQFQRRENVTS